MPQSTRLDQEMVRRGLVTSRADAKAAIEAGHVLVRGMPASRVASRVSLDDPIVLQGPAPQFVSRGGLKLDDALTRLDVAVAGLRWLDAGASTGGFTDCLLQRRAAAVIAADVGYGQLAWRLRQDERVHVLERCNLRNLVADDLPWRPQGVVADLSFISLTLVMPALVAVAAQEACFVVLVKPQFELDPASVGKGGVVRAPELWAAAISRVATTVEGLGLGVSGATLAHPRGPAGNREFFLRMERGGRSSGAIDRAVAAAVKEEGLS